MRVLLTNDDGIHADGLQALRRALLEHVPDIELAVIAPDGNRSAMARSITTRRPLWVERVEFDADKLAGQGELLADIAKRHDKLDTVVVAFGILGNQARAERDAKHAVSIVHTDYLAHVSVLTHLAELLRAQGSGQIVVFSSVAGIRVRRANYVYGSAKAGLDGFACGLSDALVGSGVHLLLVRPGFVIGRMTEGMSPAPFSSTPDQVADATVNALRRGRDVVWVPWQLRILFAIMRILPRSVWRRMPR